MKALLLLISIIVSGIGLGGGDDNEYDQGMLIDSHHDHRVLAATSAPAQCLDTVGKFTIQGDLHGCIWVGAFKSIRCPDPIAQAKCPVTCGTCPKPVVPTAVPSIVPTFAPTQCKDLSGKFTILGELRGCIWVGAYKSIRCTDPVAQAKCPVTCDTCPKPVVPTSVPSLVPTAAPTQCKDLNGKYTIQGDLHGCIWVAAFKKDRCTDPVAQAKCPVTCGTCPSQPTQAPLSNPTAQPTAKPSAQPSSQPVAKPSAQPIAKPTANPIANPSAQPIAEPTSAPIANPSAQPIAEPTSKPIANPSAQPIAKPTSTPIAKPSAQPIAKPTSTPIAKPSSKPTRRPSIRPTVPKCVDSTAIFRWHNDKARDCVWVSKHASACSYDIARVYCPVTCGSCSSLGVKPTNVPSRRPVISTRRPTSFMSLSMGYTRSRSKRPTTRPVARNLAQEEFFY